MLRAGVDAVPTLHLLRLDLPDPGRAGLHLPLYLLRGGDGGQPRVVGGPAAPGTPGVADGIGIHHGGPDVLGPQPQYFGGLHRHRGARPPDVHRAGHEADGAISVHVHGGRGGVATVEPVSHGDPPATVGALQRRVGMGMGPHGLQHLLAADPGVGHPVGHPVPCLHGILQAKLQDVHAQLLGQLVDHHLHGEGGCLGFRAKRRSGRRGDAIARQAKRKRLLARRNFHRWFRVGQASRLSPNGSLLTRWSLLHWPGHWRCRLDDRLLD